MLITYILYWVYYTYRNCTKRNTILIIENDQNYDFSRTDARFRTLRAVYEQVRYLLYDEPTPSASLSAAVFIKAHGF